MVNFYHRIVPNAAHIMRHIYAALAGNPVNLEWLSDLEDAFNAAKEALARATMLVHPRADRPTALTVDASGTAIGAVLEQDLGSWKPVAFFSRKLRQKYSAFDRELLAMYLAIRHFRYFLEGRTFTLYTDHKPLTFAISKISDPWSPRQQRHLAYISEFTTDVRHIEGKNKTVADTLSRDGISAIKAPLHGVDYEAMAAAQLTDDGIANMRRRFDHVHVDLVGPLPPSQNHRYLFTVVDRFTRWAEAIPLVDAQTTTCARAFAAHWVARFGVPADMTSDRGSQFTSEGLNWLDELPWVLLGIRTAPKEDLGCSSAELVYGAPLTVPGDFIP
ncbi:hypothetical protein LSAT2_002963, partial [Lamellibrachia satsuma]